MPLSLSPRNSEKLYQNVSSDFSFVLLGEHVSITTGQCHLSAYGTCDQRDDNWGCHSRSHFTSQVSLGNENTVYIWTAWILLCEYILSLDNLIFRFHAVELC